MDSNINNLYKRTNTPRPLLPREYYFDDPISNGFQRPVNHNTSNNSYIRDDFNHLNEHNHVTNNRLYRADHTIPNYPRSSYDNQIYVMQDRSVPHNYNNFENARYFGTMNPYDDDEYTIQQHRTTSIHRNASNRLGNKPRGLEDHRRWVRSSGDSHASSLEHHANRIVQRMEQDSVLMEDSPASEQLRKEALRDMPQCLTIKRHIKSKLTKSVSKKSKGKPLSWYKRVKYRNSIALSQFKASLKNLTYTFELWYSTLKKIEGHFGSGTATFFKFLRWLFLMNVFVMIFSVAFLVIPQILEDEFDVGNVTITRASGFDSFNVKDLITGEGYFTDTVLYYGFYSNTTMNLFSGVNYSIPYAYFFTMLVLYLSYFVVLSFSMARSYRRNYIETEGGLKNAFALKVFCGWDYSIATKEAALLKSSSIFLELKELLSDIDSHSTKKSCMSIFRTRTLQVVTHILVGILLAATGYVMWFLLDDYRNSDTTSAILTAFIINCIMLLFPAFFSFVIKYEDYKSPRLSLYITLLRTFVLELIVVGVLIAFWLQNSTNEKCWQTSLGQEIYRLILFDFFLSVVLTTLLALGRFFVYKKITSRIGAAEFDIASHTLNIIYNQTLFWVGFFFSPLLPVLVVVKLFLIWYIRSISVLALCKPSRKSWRAAQTQTLFLILTFLSLLLVFGILGYIVMESDCSGCGPFRNYDYIYQIITYGVLKLEQNSTFFKVLIFFMRPGVVALVLIGLCVRLYYVRAKSYAQRGMVEILREMLIWEAKDKEFLLEHISKVTKGRWQYNLQESRMDAIDPSYVAPDVFDSADKMYRDDVGSVYSGRRGSSENPRQSVSSHRSSRLSGSAAYKLPLKKYR